MFSVKGTDHRVPSANPASCISSPGCTSTPSWVLRFPLLSLTVTIPLSALWPHLSGLANWVRVHLLCFLCALPSIWHDQATEVPVIHLLVGHSPSRWLMTFPIPPLPPAPPHLPLLPAFSHPQGRPRTVLADPARGTYPAEEWVQSPELELNARPASATCYLCILKLVSQPLWASKSSPVKTERGVVLLWVLNYMW